MKQAKATYNKVGKKKRSVKKTKEGYIYNEKTKRFNKIKVKKGKSKVVPKVEPKVENKTELKPKQPMTITKTSTGEVIPLKLKEKKGGDMDVPLSVPVPQLKPETSVETQNRILADIISSYDNINKSFQDISNSNLPISNKQQAYEQERIALENYKNSVLASYGSILTPNRMDYQRKAYQYDNETYKIGLNSLENGLPQNPVNFENFEEEEQASYSIDHGYEPPKTSLDRAESFYAREPILVGKKDPAVVIPRLGEMASIYPYNEDKLIGGKQYSKEELKSILNKKVKQLFFRDVRKQKPSITDKKLEMVYTKHKKQIQTSATNAIVAFLTRGGCSGGIVCPPDQYSDGDQCYDKTARMDVFNRKDYIDNQTNQSKANALKPVSTPLSVVSGTKPSVDDPNPPSSSVNDASSGAVEDFVKAITPPDKGIVFGTNMDDVGSLRDWIDTVATIGEKTVDGVVSVFKALDIFSWI